MGTRFWVEIQRRPRGVLDLRGGVPTDGSLTVVADPGRTALTAVPRDTTLRGVRRTRTSGALCALFVALACAPHVSHAASIKGKVVFAGAVPAQKKVDVTIDQYVCGNEKDAGDLLVSPQKELRNAVVWIENPPAGAGRAGAARQGRDGPERMRVRSARRRRPRGRHRGFPEQRPPAPQHSRDAEAQRRRSTARSRRAGPSRSRSRSRRS